MPQADSRSYLHTTCGAETEISGPEFQALADPLASMQRTYCAECEDYFPLDEFQWSDTGETITDYYARHSATASSMDRFWCDTSGLVCLGILGLLAGSVVGIVLGMASGFWIGVGSSIGLGLVGGIGGIVVRETLISRANPGTGLRDTGCHVATSKSVRTSRCPT